MVAESKLYLSINDARELLASRGVRVCRGTVYRWAKEYGVGRLIGNRWYIRKHRLLEWLDEKEDPTSRLKCEIRPGKPKKRKRKPYGGRRGHRIYKSHAADSDG